MRFGIWCAVLLGLLAANAPGVRAEEPQAAKPKAAGPLAWAPPVLTDPVTVTVSEKNRALRLDVAKDYIIKMPATPLTTKGGLTISGGRNVVLIGGSIVAPAKAEGEGNLDRRALYLKGQAGTIHIEGLHFGGADLAEAINLDQRLGAVVQLQNLRIDTVHGTRAGHHADLVQTWAGPGELRIDRLTGSTEYQGFFLLPNQHFQDGAAPRKFDFRRMNIKGTDTSAYLLWRQTDPAFPVTLTDVWLEPNPAKKEHRDMFLWPKPSSGDTGWEAVKVGSPPGGDFVPEGVAGTAYVSPGYEKQH